MAELDETVRARTDQGFDVASRIIATDRGKRLMDEIRQLTATMVLRKTGCTPCGAAREEGESRAALRANVGGLGVALLLVGIAMALLHWATREREREQSAGATAEAVATVAATSEGGPGPPSRASGTPSSRPTRPGARGR